MGNHKKLKPNLIEPRVRDKLFKVLAPPKEEDYWEPTMSTIQQFYHHYIRPNFWLILVVIILLLLLLYRYRVIQNERINNEQRLKEEIALRTMREGNKAESMDSMQYLNPIQPIQGKAIYKEIVNTTLNEYSKEKELLREPQAKISGPTTQQLRDLYENYHTIPQIKPPRIKNGPSYPVYPSGQGTLVSPSRGGGSN